MFIFLFQFFFFFNNIIFFFLSGKCNQAIKKKGRRGIKNPIKIQVEITNKGLWINNVEAIRLHLYFVTFLFALSFVTLNWRLPDVNNNDDDDEDDGSGGGGDDEVNKINPL